MKNDLTTYQIYLILLGYLTEQNDNTAQQLINLVAELYKRVDKAEMGDDVHRAVANGTPIPDNATNGDVTKAMFQLYDFEIFEHRGYVMVFYDDFYTIYPLRWWNAPYQKEGDKE